VGLWCKDVHFDPPVKITAEEIAAIEKL